ncbi:hypothetical protein [Burkholderia cepacia]|uniref:hypothetical protein n=1 Tax=Burkholderia cepacia TaxID=292 RepID=UPI00298FA999|nr:hypothetical protein [Burkholderia cepacia]MDW9245265.1 hypothetical protein [Burkholderia cepacia]
MNTNQNYRTADLGDGVTLRECIGNPVGPEKIGTTYVYLNGKYRFTCASKKEAMGMKGRALAA